MAEEIEDNEIYSTQNTFSKIEEVSCGQDIFSILENAINVSKMVEDGRP